MIAEHDATTNVPGNRGGGAKPDPHTQTREFTSRGKPWVALRQIAPPKLRYSIDSDPAIGSVVRRNGRYGGSCCSTTHITPVNSRDDAKVRMPCVILGGDKSYRRVFEREDVQARHADALRFARMTNVLTRLALPQLDERFR